MIMHINSLSSLYSIAPGPPNSPIKPEAGLSPEQSNNAIDRVDATRAQIDNTRETVRQAATNTIERRTQRNNIETYIQSSSQATGKDESTISLYTPAPLEPIDVTDVRKFQRQAFRNEVSEIISNKVDSPQQALQQRIEAIVSERADEPNLIDVAI